MIVERTDSLSPGEETVGEERTWVREWKDRKGRDGSGLEITRMKKDDGSNFFSFLFS